MMSTAGQVRRRERRVEMIFTPRLVSSAKDAVAPLTASKAMAKKPEGSEVRSILTIPDEISDLPI